MECESRIYDQNCGCIMYYLPRIREDISICGGTDQYCVRNVMRLIESKTNSSFVCNCLPSCYAINYEAELSGAPILMHASHSHVEYKTSVLSSHDVTDLAILHVFFKENNFRSQIKEELIGFTEFLCKLRYDCGRSKINFFALTNFHSICSKYGWIVGTFHGFQCGFDCWIDLFYDISTILCTTANR